MRLKRPEGMNIIPFIDIMLVLLAIVLTISTFISHQQMTIELPKASTTEQLHEKRSHEIILSKKGEIFFDEKATPFEELKEKLKGLSKEDEIVLKADTNSSFGNFIEVIDVLKRYEHPHINILVRKE